MQYSITMIYDFIKKSPGATGSGPPSRPNRPANGTPKPPRGDGGAQGGRPNNPGPALPQFGGGDGPDSSLNDIDESDVNCDNTGTCYDGKKIIKVYVRQLPAAPCQSFQ